MAGAITSTGGITTSTISAPGDADTSETLLLRSPPGGGGYIGFTAYSNAA
jgi:hypothetical protein